MLAIVIPYYKIDFFEETLKSVAAQTDKRFTLYIGNDASPNDPFPLIEKYFPDGNYHYFNYSENLGGKNLALQWERILENVKEDWFQILGDDDMVSENFVEKFYEKLPEIEKEKSNVVKISQCWIDEHSKKTKDFTSYPQTFSGLENFRHKFLEGHRSSLSEHIFKTETYRKYKFRKFPLAWYSDDYAVLEMSENQPIFFIDQAQVYVRVSPKSISGSENGEFEKKTAMYDFYGLLLTNYFKKLPKNYVYGKINQNIHLAYHNHWKINFPAAKIYWYNRDFRNLISLPKKMASLAKNRRK